jgi:hypothetical protein
MADKKLTFIVSDESVNSYSYRVLNSAFDWTAFNENPVMLFNHNREGEHYRGPIGRWENLRLTDKGWAADAVFDETDEFALSIKKKVEAGFLKAASIRINEQGLMVSNENSLKLEGQELPTVVKCSVAEISITDIPSNSNALTLFDSSGKVVDFSKKEVALKYLLSFSHKPNNNPTKMELKLSKTSIQTLALGEGFTAEQVDEAVASLQLKLSASETKLQKFEDDKKAENLARATILVEDAQKAGKIKAEEKDSFLSLATSNYDVAKLTLDKIPAVELPSKKIVGNGHNKTNPDAERANWTLSKWKKEDYKGLLALKNDNPDAYSEIVSRQ